jgi:glutaredoxin 3
MAPREPADQPRFAMSAAIVMYSSDWCPYCASARALLKRKGLVFSEVNVDATPGARQAMRERSGGRTVPQIFIGDRHVGGCDDLHELDARGELDAILSGCSA